MKRQVWYLISLVVLVAVLAACATPTPQVIEKEVVVERRVVETVIVIATPEPELEPAKPPMAFSEALACVRKHLPAERYMTNEYLPDPTALWEPMICGEMTRVKVGMPWVLNDEEAPWYNAVELGFYKDVCLEVELVPGGPGKNHIQTLGGGAVDIAVAAGGQAIPAAVASRTPIDVVAVGTFLKGMPYCFITVNGELLGRNLTPLDLIGRKLGVQEGSDVYAHMLLDKYGIPREKVELVNAGWTPDIIMVGEADFYAGWIVNQPRLIEEKGREWNSLMYRDWVYDEYSDVVGVRQETLETGEGREMVSRFLAATYQGLVYLLEHPEESAEIAVKYGVDAQVTKEQALWRFEHQKDLVLGRDGMGLMAMNPEKWNEVVATLYQYGEIEIAACE